MAKIVAVAPELYFASRIDAGLRQAGHEVTVVRDPADIHRHMADLDILIVDLASGDVTAGEIGAQLEAAGREYTYRVLAFYSHVEAEVRQQALARGFDMVVPRSRMVREMPELVATLLERK